LLNENLLHFFSLTLFVNKHDDGRRHALNKKRIGCNSAKDIALAVRLSEAEIHQLVTEYSQWRWLQEGVKSNKVNKQF